MNHLLFTWSCTCASSLFRSVPIIRRVYNPASFWVILWSSRDPSLFNVSLPLCAGPVTLEFMSVMIRAISWSLNTDIPLNQAKPWRFSGRWWISRRILPPSAAIGGTDSIVGWAEVTWRPQFQRKSKREEGDPTKVELLCLTKMRPCVMSICVHCWAYVCGGVFPALLSVGLHTTFIFSVSPHLSVCSLVFLCCLGSLFSWILLDIVYFPKETHKVRNITCSHGSVANTLSSWYIWEFCDPDFRVFKNRRRARLLDKFWKILFCQFVVCPDNIPGDLQGNYNSCPGNSQVSTFCSFLLQERIPWAGHRGRTLVRTNYFLGSSLWGPWPPCKIL